MSDTKKQSTRSAITRDKILDTALTMFSSNGYHKTSLDEIAQESSTSKGAIYFHFPNKETLFLALVDQFANLLERRVNEATNAQPIGLERVRVALETVVATFGKYRRPAKLLLVQAVGLGAVFEQKRLAVTDHFAHLIQAHLDEAVAAGLIEPMDTEVVAYAWMGAIYNVVIQWVYSGDLSQERILSTLVPLLLKSISHE